MFFILRIYTALGKKPWGKSHEIEFNGWYLDIESLR
jgi:hypothetical protein